MIEGFVVTPARLRVAGGRVRSSGRQLGAAGRTVSQTLEGAACPGTLTGAAAIVLASAARAQEGSLQAQVEALARALDAASARYASTDALIAAMAGRQ